MVYICGLLMALADSVPGVSGGTIAYLLGCYENFINSLNSFLSRKGSKDERKTELKKSVKFLSKLGIGWIVGFVAAVLVLTSFFESHIYQISSLFIGFIVFSIPLIAYEEKEHLKKFQNLVFLVIGAALVVGITMVNPSSGTIGTSIGVGQFFYIMLAGMIAISAMVLPGISGSTMLLIFGVYKPVMDSIRGLLELDFSGLPVVAAAGIGILLGVVIIIKAVKAAFNRFHSATVYTILGLMLGSLVSIVKGPETVIRPEFAEEAEKLTEEGLEVGKELMYETLSFDNFSIVFFVIGGVVILGLQALKFVFNKKEVKTEEEK